MTQFISRAYNTFERDPHHKGIVIKRSKESRLKDEMEYYKSLPLEMAMFFPRILYSHFYQDQYEMRMEYYAYDNLGNLMIENSYDSDIWQKVFDFLFSFIDLSKNHKSSNAGEEDSRSMYIKKTETEYKNLLDNFEYFKLFEENNYIYLNGEKLRTFKILWPILKEYLENNCLSAPINIIHGDFCFSNILYGSNPINGDVILKFIDPRGSFGKIKSYGDSYYDLAKLLHSCDGGYEYFITDNFKVENDLINFQLTYTNHNKINIKSIFDKFVDQYGLNKTKIELLQGTIFIGMCARHYDSFERQKAMFLTGLRILNKVYESI
jgi:hypothetical protein